MNKLCYMHRKQLFFFLVTSEEQISVEPNTTNNLVCIFSPITPQALLYSGISPEVYHALYTRLGSIIKVIMKVLVCAAPSAEHRVLYCAKLFLTSQYFFLDSQKKKKEDYLGLNYFTWAGTAS